MTGTRRPRKPAFFWLTLLASVVYAFCVTFSVYAVARHFGVRKNPGWTVSLVENAWVVSTVSPVGRAAGHIEPGDRLLAIKGDARSAVLGTFKERHRVLRSKIMESRHIGDFSFLCVSTSLWRNSSSQ